MEKKYNLDILNISDEYKLTHENKMKTFADFTSISFEEIILNHHKKNSITSRYILNEDNTSDSNKFVVLLTQDSELIKELKLPTYTRAESPNKSLELFEDSGLDNVELKNLIKGMGENSKIDFLFNFDSRAYSISIAQGSPAKKLIRAVDQYIEEIENIHEYSDKKTSNLKL